MLYCIVIQCDVNSNNLITALVMSHILERALSTSFVIRPFESLERESLKGKDMLSFRLLYGCEYLHSSISATSQM